MPEPLSANSLSTTIAVTYDGPALATGRMDVRVLASAMASVAQLVEDSAKVIYGSDTGVRLEVSGDFRRGSFTYQAFATAISGISAAEMKSLLEWLGLISTGSGLTVFGVVRWLRGKKVTAVTRTEGNEARIVAGDHSVVVNLQVAQLVMNNVVRADLEGATQPLDEPGINVMRTGETPAEVAEVITEEDRPAFLAPPPTAESLHDGESVAVLQIVAPVFRIGNKWQFAYPGEASFYAPILDRDFLKRLQRREVSFSFGDLVKVKLRTIVTRTETGGLSTTREVVEILEIIPPPKQGDLFEAE